MNFESALVMLREIMHNNEKLKATVMIVPLGPTEWYGILARLVIELFLPLHNVHFNNMNEHLADEQSWVAFDYQLSFRSRLVVEFFFMLSLSW